MKIVSWNANGKFREKYREIVALDADIYVIQECENPLTCKDAGYRDFFGNYRWAGVYHYKGLMIFTTRPDITLTPLEWGGQGRRVFIPVRVNDEFNLVGAWACDPYCEELYDWVEDVYSHLDEETVIIGDLNSNVTLDAKHLRRSGKSFARVIEMLEAKGLWPMWHHHHRQRQGEEKTPTFYLYRHLDKPLHIDHCFASPRLVTSILIHARWRWLALSDHLPLEIGIR